MRNAKTGRNRSLAAGDLHGDASRLRSVHIHDQNTLVLSLLHGPVANGDGLRRAQHHGDQMRVGVHRLRAPEVSPGPVPARPIRRTHAVIQIVVEVGSVGRGEVQKVLSNVVDEAALHLVHAHRHGRMLAEHGHGPLPAAALGHDGLDLVGDVEDAHAVIGRSHLYLLVMGHELESPPHAKWQTAPRRRRRRRRRRGAGAGAASSDAGTGGGGGGGRRRGGAADDDAAADARAGSKRGARREPERHEQGK